jgi:hypothetical protein
MVDEKLTKQIIDRIVDFSKYCRKCKHVRLSHLKGTCLAICGTTEEFVLCGCEEFVPEDNLDYIEWLAKKRGLIK